jgi:IS5 family transposase
VPASKVAVNKLLGVKVEARKVAADKVSRAAGREVRASKEAVKRAINRAIVSWLQRRTREVNSSEFTSPFVLFLRQVSQFYLSLKTFS